MDVHVKIKKAREKLGLSQSEFASAIGVIQKDVSMIESGKKKFIPNKYIVFLISKGFDINTIFDSTNDDIKSRVKSRNQKMHTFNDSKKGIPLIPTEAFAGLGGGPISIAERDIKERYVVPDFIDADFMIRIKGSSMYPKYNSGDVVACKMISDSKFLQWNKVHVIATTEQGVLIKRLKKGLEKDTLLAVSDNPSYDPFEIPKDEILNIALVTGVIRLE